MPLFTRNQPKAGPDRPLTKSDLRVRRRYANVTTTPASSPNVLLGPGHLHKVIVNAPPGPTVIDSYSESNNSANGYLYSAGETAYGQSFTGTGLVLDKCWFYLKKSGTPTGTAVAKIYSEKHATAYGTDSLPDTLLATSGTINAVDVGTTYALIPFTFTSTDKITLADGTKYVVEIEYSGGDRLWIGKDGSSLTHGGNINYYNGGGWHGTAIEDLCFYVYGGVPLASKLQIYDSDGVDNIDTIGTINLGTTKPGSTFDYDVPLKHGLDIYPDTACDLTAIFSY